MLRGSRARDACNRRDVADEIELVAISSGTVVTGTEGFTSEPHLAM